MGIIEILAIWVWFAAAVFILSRWHMGEESDRRRDFWSKYEH